MRNAATTCWDAFGSDSDSEDEPALPSTGDGEHDLEATAEAVALSVTQYFANLIKSSGVSLKERVLAIYEGGNSLSGRLVADKLSGRGMNAVIFTKSEAQRFVCDGAVVLSDSKVGDSQLSSEIRRCLLPGGMLWIISSEDVVTEHLNLSEEIWDIASTVIAQPPVSSKIVQIQKRACTINSWSCPWMDKHAMVPEQICRNDSIGLPVQSNESYLQYERRVANELTICPSAAERTREKLSTDNLSEQTVHATILNSQNVERAVSILQQHGLVVIKGLLPSEQTLPWGKAVLKDFKEAIDRLKRHPTRPVDLMNPHQAHVDGQGAERIFEPLSYKEMAMREDLRVDIRGGPAMKHLSMNSLNNPTYQAPLLQNNNDGPFTVDSGMLGTICNWRFHPSIIAILKQLFNPKDDKLSKGNFGRWNFGGKGPDGSPQPFRIGPIGSVISCPGSGDQAIHADTPHLFEHLDCLPCHYCNIFTPGYEVRQKEQNQSNIMHEFDNDGIWTGKSHMGGTALVDGSHKLSVTAKLLAEDDDTTNGEEAVTRRQLLQLHTIRPALDTGDVIIFDNRTLHYGLANTCKRDTSGENNHAGRRPMLYLNVTQLWFHDPKNWDDRESIFS